MAMSVSCFPGSLIGWSCYNCCCIVCCDVGKLSSRKNKSSSTVKPGIPSLPVKRLPITKEAISQGINKYVIIVFSHLFCSLIFLIFSLIIHRSNFRTVTTSVLWKIFLLAVSNCWTDISSCIGLQYSSPTLSSAMLNLIPAFTYILAIIFRMEKLNWKSKCSQAKSLGTIVSIAGAFAVIFYKGPLIITNLSGTLDQLLSSQSNWILGGFFLATQALSISAWYIIQAIVLRDFPEVLVIQCYQYFISTILAAMFSLILVTDPSAWKLRLDIGLFSVVYLAIAKAAFLNSLLLWCLMRTGPLYVSMFKPLAILFSTVLGVIIFGDSLFLGSLIGAVIIVIGFYAVMWGRAKEENTIDDSGEPSSEKVPLLQNSKEKINSKSSV